VTDPAALPDFGNVEANLRFLDTLACLAPGQRILEIGSGRGTMLHLLRERGLDIVGVETSAARLDEMRARFGDVPVELVSDTGLPFPDAVFDAVLSFDVFEHIPDSDAHLAEVRRVLTPGGSYLLQTPNRYTNAVFETIRWRSFTAWKADHCALHSAAELRRRLERHGFSVTFVDVPAVTPFFRAKVRRYLGPAGQALLAIANPDRLPVRMRTNFFVRADKR
jgi:cyclopropane fatty-acyl-phospholipid synthase-like methyltransferase